MENVGIVVMVAVVRSDQERSGRMDGLMSDGRLSKGLSKTPNNLNTNKIESGK
jgi:hypothetical protein